MTVEQVINQK
jgi:hypothetical protein